MLFALKTISEARQKEQSKRRQFLKSQKIINFCKVCDFDDSFQFYTVLVRPPKSSCTGTQLTFVVLGDEPASTRKRGLYAHVKG